MAMRHGGARVWVVVAGLASPLAVSQHARADLGAIEEQAIASTYGSGVHAYFAGDFDRSYEILSQAIEAGTADPRAWYFRGLAALKLGRFDEAEADFSTGSKRESDNIGSWGVAKSLERVQGCDRLKLERHRVQARVASLQDDRRRTRLRYLDVEKAGPEVLRDRVPETVRPPMPGQPFQPPAAVEPAPAELPAEEPAAELPPATDDPAPLPAPGAEPAAEAADPFGGGEPPMKEDGGVSEL
jgi:tetratricopeptide (TPR) repeat protein